MSMQKSHPPKCSARQQSPAPLRIQPQVRDLGNFKVGRVLPAAQCPRVGPFVFFDHMGPSELVPHTGIDVRPHPHIGLSTLTFLFQGQILHRDSLGFQQLIKPGAINWMTAGRGIVHSERSPIEEREQASQLHGIQAWVALPTDQEDIAPSFSHYRADEVPAFERNGVSLQLIAGQCFGYQSPVQVYSPLFYLQAHMPAGSALSLPTEYPQRAIYIVAGTLTVAGESFAPGQMLVFDPDHNLEMRAETPAHLMLLGGDDIGHRHLWWNFCASDKTRLERAKQDWKAGRFSGIPGESDEIPLPVKANLL